MKKFKKSILVWSSLGTIGLTASVVAAGCGLIANDFFGRRPPNSSDSPPNSPTSPNSPNPDPPNPGSQSFSNKKVNLIPSSTPYQTIHNLEFSFQFTNTGGYQYNTGISGTDRTRIIPKAAPYSVFGTGWLFDWKADSEKPDSNGNISWTGYFGTNLHVIDALLNPDDGVYTPSWLGATQTNLLSFDKTQSFSLGKYDNTDGPLSSTRQNTNLTYVRLGENRSGSNTLPKTQFASNNFTNSTVRITNPNTGLSNNYSTYVDFAVMAITVNYFARPIGNNQVAQNNVWNYWIQPAMQTLKTLYPRNSTNGNLTYQSIFDPTPYVNQRNPDPGNIFIGGYPYYSNSVTSPYLADFNRISNAKGSPVWTINADEDSTTFNGHPIDLNNTSQASGARTPNGTYNANYYSNFIFNYHGQDYKQYGIGYIVTNSNLAGGSSGSMALKNDNKILGIYFGTLINSRTKQESSIGLLGALVVPQIPSILSSSYQMSPYDLIGWSSSNTTITNQNKSYFSSLESPTYLFSNI